MPIKGGLMDRAIQARRQQPGYQDFSLAPIAERVKGFLGNIFGSGYNRPVYKGYLGLQQPSVEEELQAPVSGLSQPVAQPKSYAMTPEGQYERYFKTPEFDYVFGAKARGEAAPKSVGEMQAMGSELKAPEGKDALPAYYASQSAMGRVNLEDIQNMYHSQGRSDLAAWAAANPMLAQREYMKQLKTDFPHRGEGEEIIEAYGGGEPGEGEEIIDAYNYMRNKAGLK